MAGEAWKSGTIIGLTVLLAGCGSGSSSAGAAQYPVDDALSTFYQTSQTYTLHASSGGTTYTLVVKFTPGPQTTFLGQQYLSLVLADTITSNGSVIASGGKTVLFLTGPFREFGGVLPGGVYEVDHAQHTLPDLANPGDAGPLDLQDYFSDSTLNTEIATGSRTWSLAAVTETTALFCIEDQDDLGGSPESEGDCEIIDERGNVTGLQITLTLGATTLVFK
jgi:hypothetical protein